eukprot:scaffold12220_cov204-Skeletonema_marinoi.AAC.8
MRSVHVGRMGMGRQRSANNATCNQAPQVFVSLLGGVVIFLLCRRFCHNDSPRREFACKMLDLSGCDAALDGGWRLPTTIVSGPQWGNQLVLST